MKLSATLLSVCLFLFGFSVKAKDNNNFVQETKYKKIGFRNLQFGFTPLLQDKSKLNSDVPALGMAKTVFIPLPGLSTPFEVFVGAELYSTNQFQAGIRLGFGHFITRVLEFDNEKHNSALVEYFNSNSLFIEPYITKPFLYTRNHHFFVGASVKLAYNLLDKGGYSRTEIGDLTQPAIYRSFFYQYPLANTLTPSISLRLGYSIKSKNHSFSFALLRKQDFNSTGQIQVQYSDFKKAQNALLNLTSSAWGLEVVYGTNL